eukprot:9490168-Pyramimonas_sp.AAC.2
MALKMPPKGDWQPGLRVGEQPQVPDIGPEGTFALHPWSTAAHNNIMHWLSANIIILMAC